MHRRDLAQGERPLPCAQRLSSPRLRCPCRSLLQRSHLLLTNVSWISRNLRFAEAPRKCDLKAAAARAVGRHDFNLRKWILKWMCSPEAIRESRKAVGERKDRVGFRADSRGSHGPAPIHLGAQHCSAEDARAHSLTNTVLERLERARCRGTLRRCAPCRRRTAAEGITRG